jgi:putative membrane protein
MNPNSKMVALAAGLASLGLAFGAFAQQSSATAAKGGALAGNDRTFVMKAAQGGMAEVELGKVAQERAANDAVKQFAQRMVTDHGKANEELKSVAGGKGVTLPTALDKQHQAHSEKLKRLKGPVFDREYMKHMVDDHKKTVADFEKASKNAKDADVRNFAAKTLPTLQEHLKMAQSTASQVQGAGKSGTAAGGSAGGSGGAPGTGKSPATGGSGTSKDRTTGPATGGDGKSASGQDRAKP